MNASRVKNLTFQGITFANTDYGLYTVAGSHGKATVQGATLLDVVNHYDDNMKLNLSETEKKDLIEYLKGILN